MGDARAAIYLRNLLPRPLFLPLPIGNRLLPPCATTAVQGFTHEAEGVREAIRVGILVIPMLPPPNGIWRLRGAALRAPISAAARQFIAREAGMEAAVLARMALERAIAAAKARARRPSRRVKLYVPPRGTRLTKAQKREAKAQGEEWRLARHGERARIFYAAMREAALLAGVPQRIFFGVLDGEFTAPEELVPHLIGTSAEFTIPKRWQERADDRDLAAVHRYQRRMFQAKRLLYAAQRASGEETIADAARWFAYRLSDQWRRTGAELDEEGNPIIPLPLYKQLMR